MVRHSKSGFESQAIRETKSMSGVSKIQMHLLVAEESRSHATEKEQLPRWHVAMTGQLWELFTAVSGMWFQRSAKAKCPAAGTTVIDVFLGYFRWK